MTGNYDKEKFRVTNERGTNLVTGFYQDIDNDIKETYYKFGFACSSSPIPIALSPATE